MCVCVCVSLVSSFILFLCVNARTLFGFSFFSLSFVCSLLHHSLFRSPSMCGGFSLSSTDFFCVDIFLSMFMFMFTFIFTSVSHSHNQLLGWRLIKEGGKTISRQKYFVAVKHWIWLSWAQSAISHSHTKNTIYVDTHQNHAFCAQTNCTSSLCLSYRCESECVRVCVCFFHIFSFLL